jgi:hypothetical protein
MGVKLKVNVDWGKSGMEYLVSLRNCLLLVEFALIYIYIYIYIYI